MQLMYDDGYRVQKYIKKASIIILTGFENDENDDKK